MFACVNIHQDSNKTVPGGTEWVRNVGIDRARCLFAKPDTNCGGCFFFFLLVLLLFFQGFVWDAVKARR